MNRKRCNAKDWFHKWDGSSGRRICVQCGATHRLDLSEAEHFWQKVDKGPHPKGCWLWTGALQRQGYGQFIYQKQNWRAHKLAYFLTTGSVPEGMAEMAAVIMHLCDVKICVNPAHLKAGTQQENMADMVRKGRKPSKLTPAEVTEIRHLHRHGHERGDLATKFGVDKHTIYMIVTGRIWKALEAVK